jgi:hypothetical protein
MERRISGFVFPDTPEFKRGKKEVYGRKMV